MAQEQDTRRGPISFRIRNEDLAAIDKRAKQAGLSRNAYMIRSALGELDDPSTVDRRLNNLEARVEWLEHKQNLRA